MEKDVAVSLARSLRQELESRGIPRSCFGTPMRTFRSISARFSPMQITQRLVALHAASNGQGVRIYTAMSRSGAMIGGHFVRGTRPNTSRFL